MAGILLLAIIRFIITTGVTLDTTQTQPTIPCFHYLFHLINITMSLLCLWLINHNVYPDLNFLFEEAVASDRYWHFSEKSEAKVDCGIVFLFLDHVGLHV